MMPSQAFSGEILQMNYLATHSYEEVKRILNRYTKNVNRKYIGVKFPIIVSNVDDLFNWTQISASTRNYIIQYNGILPNDVLIDYAKIQDNKATSFLIKYNITDAYKDENDFIAHLEEIYLQLVFMKNLHLKINYTWPSNFFSNQIYDYLLELFNNYINSTSNMSKSKHDPNRKDSLAIFCSKVKFNNLENRTNPKKIKAIFAFIKDFNYNLYRMFYDTSFVELIEGGTLIDVTRRN